MELQAARGRAAVHSIDMVSTMNVIQQTRDIGIQRYLWQAAMERGAPLLSVFPSSVPWLPPSVQQSGLGLGRTRARDGGGGGVVLC